MVAGKIEKIIVFLENALGPVRIHWKSMATMEKNGRWVYHLLHSSLLFEQRGEKAERGEAWPLPVVIYRLGL